MQRQMILVCHADDGSFADGNRTAVRRVLHELDAVAAVDKLADEWYAITCEDGGRLGLHAPGLSGDRVFHRMLLYVDDEAWTTCTVRVVLELMRAGDFWLMAGLDVSNMIVTHPRQVLCYPWLPDAPLLARSHGDLAVMIDRLVA